MLGLRCILDSNRWFLLRSSFVLPDLLARWILSWSKVWPMKETFRFFISGVHRSIVFFSEISTTQKKSLSQFICKLLETTFKFLIYPTNRIIKISQLTFCVSITRTHVLDRGFYIVFHPNIAMVVKKTLSIGFWNSAICSVSNVSQRVWVGERFIRHTIKKHPLFLHLLLLG